MSTEITVLLPDSKSFKLPNGVDAMIEKARGTGHLKFKNQLVPSLWVPVFRHLFQTRFAGNHVGVVLDSADKDSVESLLKEVYPLFGEEKNENARLRKYYSTSEDVYLNQVTEPNKGETRLYSHVTFVQKGQTPEYRDITTNPLVASVHNTEPIDGVSKDSEPSFEKLVYGYNTMARKILEGNAKERPGPFTGASLVSGDYIGNLDKPHPVVGEISSWMAGQASEDNPSELYRWVTEHAFSKDNADSQMTMKNVAANLLEMVGTQDRWYPGIFDMQDPKKIVERWVKSAARVGPEIGAAVVEPPSVKGITVEEYRDAVLIDNIKKGLDIDIYENIKSAGIKRAMKRWLSKATPPDNVLEETIVRSSGVPMIKYNQTLIISLVQSISRLDDATKIAFLCRNESFKDNEKLKKQRLAISDLKYEMKLLKEQQKVDTEIESEIQKKLDEVTIGSKIPQQEPLYNEHFLDSPEKVMPHNLSSEETDNHLGNHSQLRAIDMVDKSISTFHSEDH